MTAFGVLPLPWPFDYGFMQYALGAGLVVGATAPLVGVFLVQRRLSLMGDGIGHVAFAGVAGGLLLDVWPVWGALAFAIVGALVVEWLRTRRQATGDLALALIFYSGLAAGAVFLSKSSGGSVNATQYLFGQPLTVDTNDLLVIVSLGVAIVFLLVTCGRALLATALDEESARVAGIPVDLCNALLAVMTAITVVAAMRAVGVLLVAALMVLPVATARLLARSFRATVLLASGTGMVAVIGGLVAARKWDVAAGGSIVLSTAVLFAAAALFGGRIQQTARTDG